MIILEAVAKANGPVPLGQLRTLLGINRSSVFRLVNTIRRRGFLANSKGRNDYIVGPSIWRLFQNYDWSTLVSFCRPYLKALANKTGETTHLAVRLDGPQRKTINFDAASFDEFRHGYAGTIYTKALPPNTTSNIAGGQWGPSPPFAR